MALPFVVKGRRDGICMLGMTSCGKADEDKGCAAGWSDGVSWSGRLGECNGGGDGDGDDSCEARRRLRLLCGVCLGSREGSRVSARLRTPKVLSRCSTSSAVLMKKVVGTWLDGVLALREGGLMADGPSPPDDGRMVRAGCAARGERPGGVDCRRVLG